MSELENTTGREGADDLDIRALMRESDYTGRVRDEFKRNLLRELNHNFKYHPMHSRTLPVVLVALVVGVTTWHTSDVGSDGFTLQPSGYSVGSDPVVEAPMTGARLNAPPVNGSADEGVASAQDVYEQVAADAAKVISLEIWTIGGDTVHFVTCEVMRDGAPTQVMRNFGGTSRFDKNWRSFRAGPGRPALDAINRGSLPPHSMETVRFLGRDFTMGVWTWTTESSGRITYKRSMP